MTPRYWLRGITLFIVSGCSVLAISAAEGTYEFKEAAIFIDVKNPAPPMKTAARVLSEEVGKRTGLSWRVVEQRPETGGVFVLALQGSVSSLPAEGFEMAPEGNGLRITGADPRGVLYGVGWLLRNAEWYSGGLRIAVPTNVRMSPAEKIRGHQLGYRPRANSWDIWTDAQFEQYIRELAIFGANSIENIPFEDDQAAPLMKLSRRDMNRRMSEICQAYGLDYWVWTPAVFDLEDTAKRAEHIKEHEQLYQDCPELTGVFFPGGDPGDNHPSEVLPFLAELAPLLAKYHPKAKIWLSLQGFEGETAEYCYAWIQEHRPAWLGGIVCGPGSPPIPETRQRVPKEYPIRHYPDITHTVRCQYPVKWWDPAFASTLGRECINPRPIHERLIHNAFAPYMNGFLSYSDGVHDDVNKTVWSQCAWDPQRPVRDILAEYARFFFRPDIAEDAADAILSLERNWEGPLVENGGVAASLALWESLSARAAELAGNWRWQMCLVRAYYDAYTANRLRYERALEEKANSEMSSGMHPSPEAAMDAAKAWLDQADTEYCRPEYRTRVVELYEALFQSIGLQTSVKKYQASGSERGCSLDFLDTPLNNRWWLADEFEKIREMPSADEKWARLETLRTWENPGPGSFYDNVGYVGRCPHVLRGEAMNTDPNLLRDPNPEAWWWNDGYSRTRLSWQSTMDVILGFVYDALDPQAEYVFRVTGYGDAKPRANGEALTPTVYGKEIGEIKEFPIPQAITATGKITITFDKLDEGHLNWRKQSRIAEAWLIKK